MVDGRIDHAVLGIVARCDDKLCFRLEPFRIGNLPGHREGCEEKSVAVDG